MCAFYLNIFKFQCRGREILSFSFLPRCKKGSQRLRKVVSYPTPPAGRVGREGRMRPKSLLWGRVLWWLGISTLLYLERFALEDGEQLSDADT